MPPPLEAPGFARGGAFSAGPIIVGENGPELRYESRDGFIAHHNALRRMAALSGQIRAGGIAQPAPPAAFAEMATDAGMMVSGRGRGGPISYAPQYNIEISGSGLSEGELRAAIRAELAAAERRAQAELRGLLHD